jgi:hypothetical protein
VWISYSDTEPSVTASLKAIGGRQAFGRRDGKGKRANWLFLAKDAGRITKPAPRKSHAAAMAKLVALRRRQELKKKKRKGGKRRKSVSRPGTRLPNTARSKTLTSIPTSEELSQPYRTISNLKRLVREYQHDQQAYAETLAYLNDSLAKLLKKGPVNTNTASSNASRSAVRRMLREVQQNQERMRQTNRRNASQPRRDELQKWIIKFLKGQPEATRTDVLRQMRKAVHTDSIIVDVSETTISFTDRNGQTLDAKISGLKNRVSRARKSLKSL